jgi:Raf kinase inhibitor-like YbhB/YbcL family protein
MNLSSMSFYDGKAFPASASYKKGNQSPDLAFHEVPPEAKSLALICEDFDAPSGCWTHWVAWDIPPASKGLRAAIPALPVVDGVCHQGKNDFGEIGWGGPCPPAGSGTHHYAFRLFALDLSLGPRKPLTKDELLDAIDGHVLDEAEMTGTAEAPAAAVGQAASKAVGQ